MFPSFHFKSNIKRKNTYLNDESVANGDRIRMLRLKNNISEKMEDSLALYAYENPRML